MLFPVNDSKCQTRNHLRIWIILFQIFVTKINYTETFFLHLEAKKDTDYINLFLRLIVFIILRRPDPHSKRISLGRTQDILTGCSDIPQ